MDYSKANVLVVGSGIDCVHAERISRDVAKTYYWTPCMTGFPKFKEFAKGHGLGNVEKVIKMFDYVDRSDLIYFTDIGFGDIADFLRKRGHNVFGAGRGEALELERFKSRNIQHRLGLPTQHTVQIKGITKLRKYLEKNENVYVKLDTWRGDIESFFSKSADDVDLLLDEIESAFGPLKEEQDFIVEDQVENGIVEYGFDLIFNGTKFLQPYLFGIEHKAPYLGHFRNDMPKSLQNTMDKLTPLFKALDLRGMFADEEILVDEDTSYLIDATCRPSFPLSTIYTELFKNYTEVIFKTAEGKDVDIDVEAPFCGCLPLNSQHAGENWLKLNITKGYENRIKPVYGCQIDGKLYAVKGFTTVACLIAWGNSLDDVVGQLKDLTKEIDAYELEKETSDLDEILKDIETLKKAVGIEF